MATAANPHSAFRGAVKRAGAAGAVAVALVGAVPQSAHAHFRVPDSCAMFDVFGYTDVNVNAKFIGFGARVPRGYRGLFCLDVLGPVQNITQIEYKLKTGPTDMRPCYRVNFDAYSFIDGRHIWHNEGQYVCKQTGIWPHTGRYNVGPLHLSHGDVICASMMETAPGSIRQTARTCHRL